MMTIVMLALLVIVVSYYIVAATPVQTKVYDQRQTGDLNVQVDLKDVHVVALINSELLEDYMDYDYFYDYADFTIKPSNNDKPGANFTTTEKNDITEISELFSFSKNSTVSISPDTTNSTERFIADAASSTSNANNNNNKDWLSEENNNQSSAVVVVSSNMAKPTQVRSQKRCKSGYIPTGNGQCRRASRPLSWLLPFRVPVRATGTSVANSLLARSSQL
ncbi:uncharacterized protein LOC109854171 isoform X3 [Pseudomyrmex gracilis]|uniref:uncharacterized protein LOC109854171 isoform X3 n=1 Tax=Pseudomyrmex gracilis TaxID=219809 RepID=UPI00099490DE|nr:uncharacterized protein LOC109854171 isoform X3 [Pseudomyrmex gracilis]